MDGGRFLAVGTKNTFEGRRIYITATVVEVAVYLVPLILTAPLVMRWIGGVAAIFSFVLLVEALARPEMLEDIASRRWRYLFKMLQAAVVVQAAVVLVSPSIFYLPLLFTAVIFLYLNLLVREPVLPWLIACHVLLGTVLTIWLGPLDLLQIFIFAIMAILTILMILGHGYFLTGLHQDLQSAEVRAATQRSLFQFLRFSTSMVAHDVNNFLMLVARAAERGRKFGEVGFAEELDKAVTQIHESMRVLQLENRVSLPLISALHKAMANFPAVDFRLATELTHIQIMANRHLLVGILHNIFSNAQEAWDRKKLSGCLRIRIHYDFPNRELIIEDNAGGFDLEGIMKGHSEKIDTKSPHGLFLKSMLDPGVTAMLAIRFRIEKINSENYTTGTKVMLTFL